MTVNSLHAMPLIFSLLASERLPEDAYILKSFIFSNGPDEWCYSVEEPLHNMLQMIDITSHETGEPSRFAKMEIPMYGKSA
jgi:hypothetical protein